MAKHVFLFDGPIGVGKTTLGRAVATNLEFAFIDGDAHCQSEHWLRSVLHTGKSIVETASTLLRTHPGVIIAYPVRCTNWIFYRERFARLQTNCHCVGLAASAKHIGTRERCLSAREMARSCEMMQQGYGRRNFSCLIFRTDESDFAENTLLLTEQLRQLISK